MCVRSGEWQVHVDGHVHMYMFNNYMYLYMYMYIHVCDSESACSVPVWFFCTESMYFDLVNDTRS